MPEGREITTVVVPGWLRGLVVVSPNELLVGTGPSIALVDLDAQRVTRRLELSDNPAEAVHGLAVCPPRPERC